MLISRTECYPNPTGQWLRLCLLREPCENDETACIRSTSTDCSYCMHWKRYCCTCLSCECQSEEPSVTRCVVRSGLCQPVPHDHAIRLPPSTTSHPVSTPSQPVTAPARSMLPSSLNCAYAGAYLGAMRVVVGITYPLQVVHLQLHVDDGVLVSSPLATSTPLPPSSTCLGRPIGLGSACSHR
jgi:hypothetical protein